MTSTFPLFALLPTELRFQIWILNTALGRDIPLQITLVHDPNLHAKYGLYRFKAQTPVPSLLHTCSEARRIGLMHYHAYFKTGNTGRRCIYVNPKVDLLFIRVPEYVRGLKDLVDQTLGRGRTRLFRGEKVSIRGMVCVSLSKEADEGEGETGSHGLTTELIVKIGGLNEGWFENSPGGMNEVRTALGMTSAEVGRGISTPLWVGFMLMSNWDRAWRGFLGGIERRRAKRKQWEL